MNKLEMIKIIVKEQRKKVLKDTHKDDIKKTTSY